MKKVLLTGAAGFIGYHFSDFLLKKGFEIYGVDDLNNNYDKKITAQLKLVINHVPNTTGGRARPPVLAVPFCLHV